MAINIAMIYAYSKTPVHIKGKPMENQYALSPITGGADMARVLINIKDNQKTHILLSLLRELPSVEIEDNRETRGRRQGTSSGNFSNIFGIWKNRNITLDDIRKKAWERR